MKMKQPTSLQMTSCPTRCSALMASKQWYLQYNTTSSKSSLGKWLATKYPCKVVKIGNLLKNIHKQ